MRPMRFLPTLALLVSLVLTSGCSIKQLALNAVADELSGGTGGSFTEDPDLQFIGEALPFGLKLMEGINGGVPKHVEMKLTLASGFTQYGVVYVEWPAEQLKYSDYEEHRRQMQRAKQFYLRAHNYALDGLDLKHPGFRSRLYGDLDALLAEMTAEDVPFLFWMAASLLSAASTDLEDPEMFAALPIGGKAVMRAYELDSGWSNGLIASTLISLEPNLPGPDPAGRAEARYEEALKLTEGRSAGVHVSLATAVARKAQDKERFVALLEKALSFDLDADPDNRLSNDYAQQKARFLLEHLDDMFL
ncbi:MAG: hypothetical protein KDA24_13875 [Deltaproteobacteria bacterium]|nr:hypothetical protein [Deltaproteobacteria bacterium]